MILPSVFFFFFVWVNQRERALDRIPAAAVYVDFLVESVPLVHDAVNVETGLDQIDQFVIYHHDCVVGVGQSLHASFRLTAPSLALSDENLVEKHTLGDRMK